MAANIAEIAGKILELIEPLTSEERMRAIQGALAMAGEVNAMSAPGGGQTPSPKPPIGTPQPSSSFARAQSWMAQHNVSQSQLDQIFNLHDDAIEVIAAIPGTSKRKQTVNVYILAGLARLITAGELRFTDEFARNFARTTGCYDQPNHSNALKGKGNAFSGDIRRGWTLTQPGLVTAAALVREIAGET